MVWPLDIQRLYFVGPGALQTIDAMFISGARNNKSAKAQMKMLWDEIQMRPDAKGIGSLFPQNGGNGTITRFSSFCVSTEKYVSLPRDTIEETTQPIPHLAPQHHHPHAHTDNAEKKDICARQGSFTNHLGKSKMYSLPLYTPRD